MFDPLWWVVLIGSVLLIAREMGRWLRKRTLRVETWANAPRVHAAIDEIDELSDDFYLSYGGQIGSMAATRLRLFDVVSDRISLRLNLERNELYKSLHEPTFLEQTFTGYPLLVRYLTKDWRSPNPSETGKEAFPHGKDAGKALFNEVTSLLDSVERWEKQHGHQRSL